MKSSRHTTFTVTLVPSSAQEVMLRQHCGASRFAYNWGLATVRMALEARDSKIPWTGFDLINAFNRWKLTEAAGNVDGKPGLPWRSGVCAQVFEEALVDLGRGLSGFSASKRGKRRGPKARFPVFKRKGRCRDTFRLRNKGRTTKSSIRLGDQGPRSLTLPKLGCFAVRQCTRKLRRMLRKDRCRIMFATVVRSRGRWHVRLNCEAAAFVPPTTSIVARPIGIDRGLRTFAVIADKDGGNVRALNNPRPMQEGGATIRRLRRACRAVHRKCKGSRKRYAAAAALGNLHGRIRDLRADFLHRASTNLIKNHGSLVLEDLNTSGLMKNRCLARSIADSGWAIFARQLTYKGQWWGRTVVVADRLYPSTKRCSRCGHVAAGMSLSQREFVCTACDFRADRDVNAAMNLAAWPELVAGKHPETRNACGGRSAGADGFTAVA